MKIVKINEGGLLGGVTKAIAAKGLFVIHSVQSQIWMSNYLIVSGNRL